MQRLSTRVEWHATSGPGDTAPLEAFLATLPLDRLRRLVVLGKTEGTATANDFGRDLALAMTRATIARIGGPALCARATTIFSMGCEGIAAPGVILLADTGDAAGGLRMGGAASAELAPAEIGGPEHVEAVADTVTAAAADAGLAREAVRLVLVKSPVLTPAWAADLPPSARRFVGDTGRARGIAGLGAAMALGELPDEAIAAALAGDPRPHGRRCMAFSGTETRHIEVVVLGEAGVGDGQHLVTAALAQPLDRGAITRALDAAGIAFGDDGLVIDPDRVPVSLFKAGIGDDGCVAGERTTVRSSEVAPDKQLRAAASGFVAGILGHPRAFISGGAEHQAPPGGGLFAAVVGART